MIDLVDLQMVRQKNPEEIEISPNANSLDLLQAVYRSNDLPLHTRMRAAMAALKHEVPALLATAIVNDQDFATLLDKAIARSQSIKLIEARPNPEPEPPINATAEEKPTPPQPDPLSRVYSNRMWRRFNR